jgi:hypothetical protein
VPRAAAAQASGAFVLGFAELRNMIAPAAVGDCLEDQQTVTGDVLEVRTPSSRVGIILTRGDAFQRTTRGVIMWSVSGGQTFFGDDIGVFSRSGASSGSMFGMGRRAPRRRSHPPVARPLHVTNTPRQRAAASICTGRS